MGQKVLGLDIGSYSIKGAIFDVSFGSFTLTDLYESGPLNVEELSAEEKIQATGEAIKNLFTENPITYDIAISAIPGTLISTRILTLPFDKGKVDRVLPFEIENYLPFPLDELIIDRHTIISTKTMTTVLAAAVKKEVLASHLATLKIAGIDPKLVDIDSFALANVYPVLKMPKEETFILVDIGHSKTLVSIVAQGSFQFTRTLLKGGKNLTNALRMSLDLTYEQAEEVKIRHGMLETAESRATRQEIKKISDTLKKTIDPIIEEIGQTIQSYKAQNYGEDKTARSINKILLCGGTSLLKNIESYFYQQLKIETIPLHCFPSDHEISRKLGNRERVMTNSIALGLKTALKSQGSLTSEINLRKGEFTYQQEFKNLRGRVSFVGTWLAILIAVVMVNFGVRYYKLSVRSSKIDREVLRVFSESVKDYSKNQITSSDKALTIMNERIKKFRKQIDVLTAGLSDLSALIVLKEIHSRTPRDVTVDVQELNILNNSISLKGEIDSFSSVDKMIASLSKYEPFTKVEKGEISDSAEPKKKKFSINITVGENKDKE